MVSCPECGSTYVRRISRTPLMRLLWSSRHILCRDCGARSVVFPKLTAYLDKRRHAAGGLTSPVQQPHSQARGSVRT